MIAPDFRTTEPAPIVDAYKLFVSQNHGKLRYAFKVHLYDGKDQNP